MLHTILKTCSLSIFSESFDGGHGVIKTVSNCRSSLDFGSNWKHLYRGRFSAGFDEVICATGIIFQDTEKFLVSLNASLYTGSSHSLLELGCFAGGSHDRGRLTFQGSLGFVDSERCFLALHISLGTLLDFGLKEVFQILEEFVLVAESDIMVLVIFRRIDMEQREPSWSQCSRNFWRWGETKDS